MVTITNCFLPIFSEQLTLMETSVTPPSTLKTIIQLLRWDKPAGRLILMLPALWALFLAAHGTPPLPLTLVIILGSVVTSAAGCVVNDLWDRDIDPQVERTRQRPLASRQLTVTTAIIIAIIAFICAGILALYLNFYSFCLCVAAIPVIIGYPLAKRVFPVPQLILSIAWGFSVLISWSAIQGQLDFPSLLLTGAVVTWTLGFDTVYAMSDKEDDLKLGINSSAIFFQNYASEAVFFFFFLTLGLLTYLGFFTHLHQGFWIALILAGAFWLKEYLQLRNLPTPSPIYAKIFQENVGIGFIILIGIISGCLL